MPTVLDVFISSKMTELKPERDALHDLIRELDYGDLRLRAWIFEAEDGAPASNRPVRDVYLQALQNSALYIGLFWKDWGEWTIDEFDRATMWGVERHIYVKHVDAASRDPRLAAFLEKRGDVRGGITAKRFQTIDGLRNAVKASIEAWIADRLLARPGGASAIHVQHPDDIPGKPRKLIGREHLLRELSALLQDGERVLLHGFGGAGKTALAAMAAAARLAAGASVLWLDAGSASADALFAALARPFGDAARDAVGREQGDARAQIVRAKLRDSAAKLLVLDDCWNGQALFAVLKAVPSEMPVLATARQRYSLDRMREVGELPRADALRLLSFHADYDWSADAQAAALCRTLGNNPFAVEIAGKSLRVRRSTPAELLRQLKDAPHTLRTPLDFSETERAGVKELLDASVAALDKDARRVFFAFGAFFAPQATVDMVFQYLSAEFIWNDEQHLLAVSTPAEASSETVYRILRDLEDCSLVERTLSAEDALRYWTLQPDSQFTEADSGGKKTVEVYRMHDLAFSYVRAQTADEQRKKALDVCLAYTFLYNAPRPQAFAMLHPELDNLMGAAAWALDRGHYLHVERLAENLWYRGKFLDHQGFNAQGARLYQQAVAAAQRRGDAEAWNINRCNLATIYMKAGRIEEADPIFIETLAWARREKQRELEEKTLLNLSTVSLQRNDRAKALELLMEGFDIALELRDRAGASMILCNMGDVHLGGSAFPDAYYCYSKAAALQREIQDW